MGVKTVILVTISLFLAVGTISGCSKKSDDSSSSSQENFLPRVGI